MDKGDACAYTVSVIRNIRYLLAKAVKSDVYSAVLTLIAFLCYYFEAYFVLVGFMVTAALLALIFQRSVIYAFDMPFRVPWKAMGISALSVFLVVFVTMLYAMSKIKKDDPIEALKNENT